MKSILEELWYGNICPETDKRSNTEEMKQLMKYMARHHDSSLCHAHHIIFYYLAKILDN